MNAHRYVYYCSLGELGLTLPRQVAQGERLKIWTVGYGDPEVRDLQTGEEETGELHNCTGLIPRENFQKEEVEQQCRESRRAQTKERRDHHSTRVHASIPGLLCILSEVLMST